MPGLVLVAALSKNPANLSTISSRPTTRVYDGDVSIASVIDRPEEVAPYREIPFSWPVVGEWTHRLGELRLLGYQSIDARGGFGSVYLTELGLMLARWTAFDEPAAARERKIP